MHDAHPGAQPFDDGFDFHDVAGMHRPAVPHAFNSDEIRQAVAVFRLCEDQNRADLGDRFRQDCRRQDRRLPGTVREIALAERHVLDADDTLVGFELGNAIDEQKREPMGKDPFDRRVVEGEREVHRLIVRGAAMCQECQGRAWLSCEV